MKKSALIYMITILFWVSASGCTNISLETLDNETDSESVKPVHQVENEVIEEDTDANTNLNDENLADIDVEELPPPCTFSDSSSLATVSPHTIYYTLGGDNRIFHINVDEALGNVGTYQPEQLTFDEVYQFQDIAFTPEDGGWLAILERQGELFLMQEGDTRLQKLTEEIFPEANMVSISPNGKWIGVLYDPDYDITYDNVSVRMKVRLINRDSGEQIRLESDNKGYSMPVWSSSGEEIAYHVYDSQASQVHVMDIVTQEESLISEPGECHVNLAWSQDSNSLAYNTTSSYYPESAKLIVTEINPRKHNLLFKIDPSYHFIDHITGWSPSGELIMFESIRNPNGPTICIASANGEGVSCPFFSVEKDVWIIPFWMPDDQIGVIFFDTLPPSPDFRDLQFNHLEVLTPPQF